MAGTERGGRGKITEAEAETRAERARKKAESLFSEETWREIEPRVFIAASREPKGKRQEEILEKELIQARILTAGGSAVYLLPEPSTAENIGVKHPDAVIDGYITEFKTIMGSVEQVERRFKQARKKAECVFLKIDSSLSKEKVLSKLKWVSRRDGFKNGTIIVHFSEIGETHYLDIADFY